MNLAFNVQSLTPTWTPGSMVSPFFAKLLVASRSNANFIAPRKRSALMKSTDVESTSARAPASSETRPSGIPKSGFGFSDSGFASSVEGEWFGYECSFSVCNGEARNIPDRYVPDEFRNWGVEIKGFDSLTSSKIFEDGPSSLLMKLTRAMPSVGCEADAVVPEVHAQTFSSVDKKRISGGFSDGTFICGPAVITDERSQKWDICLMEPSEGSKSRVRLQFGLVDEPYGAVNAVLEHWDAPFCNGEVLPGCGGENQSFAGDGKMNPATELVGKWDINSIAYKASSGEWEVEERCSKINRDETMVSAEINVVLPRGITVGIATAEDGAKTIVAGWKSSESHRIVSRQMYGPSGALVRVSRDVESRAS